MHQCHVLFRPLAASCPTRTSGVCTFGLIFKYEGTTEKDIGLRGLTTRLARAYEVMLVMLQKLTEEIAECYEHARQCRERAELAVTSKDFLE